MMIDINICTSHYSPFHIFYFHLISYLQLSLKLFLIHIFTLNVFFFLFRMLAFLLMSASFFCSVCVCIFVCLMIFFFLFLTDAYTGGYLILVKLLTSKKLLLQILSKPSQIGEIQSYSSIINFILDVLF